MANTTFSGPVRSENGFDLINKNSVGEKITDIGLTVIEKSLTVAAAGTTGTSSDALPTNFIAVSAVVVVTSAASNAVNIADLGVSGDTDGYLDGINVAANSTGFKGHFACNGTEWFGSSWWSCCCSHCCASYFNCYTIRCAWSRYSYQSKSIWNFKYFRH